jgi:hypothetical protein
MNRTMLSLTASALAVVALVTGAAFAQAPAPPTPALPPAAVPTAGAAGAAGGGSATLAVLVVIGALLLIVGIGVKLYDLKRKRDADAVHLQAQVSDALLRDETLAGMPITPTGHVPLWSGTPAVIELSGRVPSAYAREAALRIARSEATRLRSDVEIVDHMSEEPAARVA